MTTKNYEGYKLYEIQTRSINDIQFLQNHAMNHTNDIDIFMLSLIVNRTADILVNPQYCEQFEESLDSNEIPFKIKIHDIAKYINKSDDDEKIQKSYRFHSVKSFKTILDFTRYYRYDDINKILNTIVTEYYASNKIMISLKNIGNSYEGRPINTISISAKDNLINNKKIIFIDGGIHAREWIAPATALYVIHQLLENSIENQYLLNTFQFVILPVVNPDGYEYTHEKSRLWRKTRRPIKFCYGVDGNRNFNYHWGEIGSSTAECQDIYQGERPFSEPETQIIDTIMNSIKENCKLYLTLHSYGNYLLYPWGFTSELPPTWKDMHEIAMAGADAIYNSTGTLYQVGSSTNVLYAAAGGSDDYAYGKYNIPVAITMELPGGGNFGFDVPESDILRVVHESWIGIKAMTMKIAEKY